MNITCHFVVRICVLPNKELSYAAAKVRFEAEAVQYRCSEVLTECKDAVRFR